MSIIDSYSQKFEESVSFFQRDISAIRTGRATPALVEQILVESYGSKMPLIGLASISTPDAKTISIQPWDKSILKDIEKAIAGANLNIQPVVEGGVVRLSMPPLTEENRKKLVKVLSQKAESARVSVRQLRDKIRQELAKEEGAGSIGEDEKFKMQKQLNEAIKKYTDRINEICALKEKEIMTV